MMADNQTDADDLVAIPKKLVEYAVNEWSHKVYNARKSSIAEDEEVERHRETFEQLQAALQGEYGAALSDEQAQDLVDLLDLLYEESEEYHSTEATIAEYADILRTQTSGTDDQ